MTKSRKAFVLLLIVLCAGTAIHAQIDPFTVMTIWQNGIPVGVAYSADRAAATGVYAEHLILYPNYRTPTAANGIATDFFPLRDLAFRTELEFFQNAPWGAGYRYARKLSYDTNILPGR